MKKLLLGVLALLVILLAVVLVAPSFIDWTARRDQIAAEISSLSGRTVTIDGQVDFALLPEPVLTVSDVSLANIRGGSAPLMAQVEQLDIQVAFLPLLQGQVQVESFVLVKPEILLEVLPDGRANWDFSIKSEGQATRTAQISLVPDSDDGSTPGLEQGAEQGGNSASQSQASGTTTDYFLNPDDFFSQIRFDNFAIQDGTLTYRDELRQERIEQVTAEVSADSLNGPFSFSGSARVRGITTKAEVGLGRLLKSGASTLNATLSFPDASATFRFNGALSNHPETVSAHGKLELSGDSLAAALRLFAGADGPLPPVFAQPFGVEGDLTADQTSIAAQKLQIFLGGLNAQGHIDAALDQAWDVTGRLSAKHLDLDKVFEFGAVAEPIEKDESASPRLSTPSPFSEFMDNVSASLKLSVDTLVYRRQVVRQILVDTAMTKDELSVDQATALLPGGSDIAVSGKMSLVDPASGFSGRVESGSDNFRGLLRWLGANLKLVPANRLRKMSLSSRFKVTKEQLSASQMDFRVDTTRATGGVVMALRERPGLGIGLKLDRLNLDAYFPSRPSAPSEDEEEANQDRDEGTTAALSFLNSFDANVNLGIGNLTVDRRRLKNVTLDATLRKGNLTVRDGQIGAYSGARIAFRGEISELAKQASYEGQFQIEAEKARGFISALGLDLPSGRRIGALFVKGSAKGNEEQVEVSADLSLLGGEFQTNGSFFPPEDRFDVSLTVDHPSLAQLARNWAHSYPLSPELGGVRFTASFKGEPSRFMLDSIDGTLGEMAVAGDVLVDLNKDRPETRINLETGPLELLALLPVSQKSDKDQGQTSESTASVRRWARDRFDLEALRSNDVQLEIRAAALKLGRLVLPKATILASLEDGRMTLSNLSAGEGAQGSFSATGDVVASHELELELQVQGLGLPITDILPVELASHLAGGTVSVEASLSTDGDNQYELISSLAGEGQVSALLDFPGIDQAAGADGAKEEGYGRALGFFAEAFADGDSELSGSFAVNRGVFRYGDIKVEGVDKIALGEIQVNLSAWQVTALSEFYESASPRIPFATLTVKGPLDSPESKIDGVVPDSQSQ
ncbi:MAG: AsmA family protein [Pseudomonadota bacterium]